MVCLQKKIITKLSWSNNRPAPKQFEIWKQIEFGHNSKMNLASSINFLISIHYYHFDMDIIFVMNHRYQSSF